MQQKKSKNKKMYYWHKSAVYLKNDSYVVLCTYITKKKEQETNTNNKINVIQIIKNEKKSTIFLNTKKIEASHIACMVTVKSL